jgi:hypothetical protein
MPETQEEYTERLKDMLKHPKAEWFTPRPGMVAMADKRGAGLVNASAVQRDKSAVTQTVGFDVPDLKKRSDQERATHMAKRLYEGVKARQPEAVDAALREYQVEKWTSGEPLSFEECQAWAARLLRTALAKSQEH